MLGYKASGPFGVQVVGTSGRERWLIAFASSSLKDWPVQRFVCWNLLQDCEWRKKKKVEEVEGSGRF